MVLRFKVTKTPDSSGEILLDVDRSMDVRVLKTFVTLPARSSNAVRDVVLRRPDGTILGTEKAYYCTSQSIGLVFSDSFVLPKVQPDIVVDTGTMIVTATGDITIEVEYEEA